MRSEHLREDQIEILLDEESGTDDAVTRAHLAECDTCRQTLQDARRSISLLEHIPYHAPSPNFSARVMSQVQIFEPLHVTILDTIERWIPSSGRLRLAMSASALVMGLMLTSVLVWVGTRIDSLVFLTNMGIEQARLLFVGLAQDVALAIVGEPTLTTLGLTGTRRIWFTAALLGGSALISTVGLRVLATAARRRRS